MWKLMIGAPKDRDIIVVDAAGGVHKARWVDQTPTWRRNEVHAFVAGDHVIEQPKLWADMPSEYERNVAHQVS